MILSDASRKTWWSQKRIGLVILGLAFFGLMFYVLPKLNLFKSQEDSGYYFCDAESVSKDKFIGQSGGLFDGANTQNDAFAYSGSHSSKVVKGEGLQFGFGFTLKEFQKGETYKATVWRFLPLGGSANLVVSGTGEREFYKSEEYPVEKDNGWEKLQIIFKIPQTFQFDEFKIYVYSNGQHEAYFDDLKIERISAGSPTAFKDIPVLEIRISDAGMRKLERKRQDAYRAGILERAADDWVKAKLKNEGSNEEIRAELRLKGDWLDHLEGSKWSFRVKTKGEQVWNRMRYFSLHTPKARAFLNEWLLHKFFEKEDVLTTKYDFVIVKLNGKNLGVYAFEEHFDKILVERQKRREGPIVRFSEDGFWAAIKRNLEAHKSYDFDLKQTIRKPEAAEIKPFQDAKINSTPVLASQFEIAQNLLFQYKFGLRSAEQIFDLDRMAKYYAICEAMSAFHGIAWHNQRFYYNPVTSKLEPIGFDGFKTSVSRHSELLGSGALNPNRIKEESIDNLLFIDKEFTRLYAFYLRKYCDREYLQSLLAEFEEEILILEDLMNSEFEDYKFQKQDFIDFAQRMRALLFPFDDLSVKAHVQSRTPNSKNLKIANFHSLPIEIIGTGPTEQLMTDTFVNGPLLEGYVPRKVKKNTDFSFQMDSMVNITPDHIWKGFRKQSPINYSELTVGLTDKYLFFSVLGVDSVFRTMILDLPVPINYSPVQDLLKEAKLVSNDIYNVSEGLIYFKKGTYQISESIIIPKGYRVIFEKGVQLDFRERSKFISFSPVFMKGTAEHPIKIYSSDKTANGFTIIQAIVDSELNYVVFKDLNTLNFKGWNLTGGVTFYESDVEIKHCVFRNNHCEDALNLIRSQFSLNSSTISHTFGDGLDADFCKGYINNTRFQNTTNDAMDFSGSNILIQDCIVESAGDKGVSVGEDSDVSIFNIDIKKSIIGVAAKDLSVLVIKKINLSNCEQGFVAYQKKPEYGGSNIVVDDFVAKDVKRLHNIREKCVLQLKDKLIKGK